MKPIPRDLMVARVVRDAMWWGEISDYSLAALIESLPEPAEQEQAAQDEHGGKGE
jgi:hypothetical protein